MPSLTPMVLNRRPTSPAALYAFLDVRSEPIEMHVAGVAFPPHAADAYLCLLQIGDGEPGAVQHCLGRALAARLSDAGGIFVHGAQSWCQRYSATDHLPSRPTPAAAA